MSAELKILIVEDRLADAELVERALRKGGLQFKARRVEREPDFVTALADFAPDLVLSDLSLPAFSGTDALRLLRESHAETPLIFISGTVGDEKAVDLLKLGAADYVIKDNLVRLVPVVERTLRAVQLDRERRDSEKKYRDIFERGVVGIFHATRQRRYLTVNPAYAHFHGFKSPAEMVERVTDIKELSVRPERVDQGFRLLEENGMLSDFHVEHFTQDGGRVWLSLDGRVVKDGEGNVLYYEGFAQEITRRKVAETELEAAQSRLIEASRYAGMAEVATNVLHNVGNVLNSVNVATSLLTEKLRNSALPNLGRAVALLREHETDLPAFMRDDPRARPLVTFLEDLTRTLEEEREAFAEEIRVLGENIEHINSIVAMQQHYTSVLGVVETVPPRDLMEDALRMNAAGLVRHGISIQRHYSEGPLLSIERHKVLQILVNLISNAKYAMDGVEHERLLRVSIAPAGSGGLALMVADNGIGIPVENLTRIFEHGFSTRQGGHGFGLHSSALAARELGGSLTACSDGPGRGAAFTLELPVSQPLPHPFSPDAI